MSQENVSPETPNDKSPTSSGEGIALPPSERNSETPQAASLSPLPTLPGNRFDRELQEELALVDPLSDGWSSEAVADEILGQLKQFAKWADHGREGDYPLQFVEGFQGAILDATGLPTVFKEPPFHIVRGSITRSGGKDAWLASWRPAQESHFKLIQIGLNHESPNAPIKATLLVDRTFLAGETLEQENSAWMTEWVRSDSDSGPVFKSLKVPFYERAEKLMPSEGTLFKDATRWVMGQDAAFDAQLKHGVDYWRDRLDWRFGIEVTGPHGLAVGDVNGDGLDDVYICEPGGLPNRLLIQQPNGTVRDAASEAGLDFVEPTHSALFVDWDNDGDQDIALSAGRHVFFYENDGNVSFRQKAVAQSQSIARSLAAADFDKDGDVDLYVCGYFNRSGDSVGLGRPMPYHDANNGVENHLLANLGNWEFEDITAQVGLDQNNTRFSYAAVWEDADNDGDLDLYVANDFGRNNFYRNDNGQFQDVAAAAGIEDISAGMSVSWGDYNQDGLMDLYVGNMFSSAGNRVAYQRQYRAGLQRTHQRAFQRHARGNTLFENRGDGTFQDVTIQAGVNMGRWSWGSNFADVNNDSREDLLIANGMVTSTEDTGDL